MYLIGHTFSVITDNSALKWLNSLQPKGRTARWIMDLQEFDFTVKHRPGGSNQNADALSRLNHSPKVCPSGGSDSIVHAAAFNCLVGLIPDTNVYEAQHNDPAIKTEC